ncbi:MAG: hypothetical protein K2N94_17100, partial [Lachnospiraceae bacterium]|nr:hypothetical protein [Lachnospiraceae bacterium]
MELLHRSAAAAVLIMVIIVLRALAVNRLPKAAFRALWLIAVMRLLLPFSVPSPFSLYSWGGRFVNLAVENMAGNAAGNAVGDAHDTDGGAGQGEGIAPDAGAGQGAEIIPVAGGSRWDALRQIVWVLGGMRAADTADGRNGFSIFAAGIRLAGTCLLAVCFAVSYIRCRKKFQMSLPAEQEAAGRWLAEQKGCRRVCIRVSDRISSPLTYGIIRPVILLPKGLDCGEGELRQILEHEYAHIRHFDAANKIVLAVTLCIHWFNPFVWALYILANRDMELYCDEAVVRRGGETAREDYALALIRMEEVKRMSFSLYSYFSKNAMEERIIAIMKTKKRSMLGCAFAFVLIAGTATVFATSATKGEAAEASEQQGNGAAPDNPDQWICVTPIPGSQEAGDAWSCVIPTVIPGSQEVGEGENLEFEPRGGFLCEWGQYSFPEPALR